MIQKYFPQLKASQQRFLKGTEFSLRNTLQRIHKYFTVDFFSYKEKDRLLQVSEMKGVTAANDDTLEVISDLAFGKNPCKLSGWVSLLRQDRTILKQRP